MRRHLVVFCLFFLIPASVLAAEAGQDLPFLSRYPGSIIKAYHHVQYDEVTLPLGPAGPKSGQLSKSVRLEGEVTYIRYEAPKGRSSLEVIRNYQQALQTAGFRNLWGCSGARGYCYTGDAILVTLWGSAPTGYSNHEEPFLGEQQRMVTMEHRAANGQRTLVFVHDYLEFGNTHYTTVYAVQAKAMETGMVQSDASRLNAGQMATALAQQGRFAMELPFDFNKATLRADAMPTITELTRLMTRYPRLRVRLEGHTDAVGTATYNRKLSEDRARAVKAALMHAGIAAGRMETMGFGATRPVADNGTEEGRSHNRRVEVINLTPGAVPAPTPSATGDNALPALGS